MNSYSTNKMCSIFVNQLLIKLCKQRLLLFSNGFNHLCNTNMRCVVTNSDTNINSDVSVNDVNDDSDHCEYVCEIERGVPKTIEEYAYRKRLRVNQPSMPRLSRVVILGAPNAGKSTLTNHLVGHRISSVSSKVHTTRYRVNGVIVENDTQVEILDTPGLVTYKHCLKHKLSQSFISDPLYCVGVADVIAVTNDVTNSRERERLNSGIIMLLNKYRHKESILILNKIDKIKEKRKLIDITTRLSCGVVGGVCSMITPKKLFAHHNTAKNLERIFEETERKLSEFDITNDNNDTDDDSEQIGWPHFSKVFYVSAINGDGVDDIRQYLLSTAKFGSWLYHSSQVTDQNPQELLKFTIREKCLDFLPQEIPYKIRFTVSMWDVDRAGNLIVSVVLLCPQRYMSLLIGPKGQTIATIAKTAREDLANTFHCEVSLKLIAKQSIASKT